MVSHNEILNAVKALVEGNDVCRILSCEYFKKVWICNVCTAVRALGSPTATDEEIKAVMLDMNRAGIIGLDRLDLPAVIKAKWLIEASVIYPLGKDNGCCCFHFVTVRI